MSRECTLLHLLQRHGGEVLLHQAVNEAIAHPYPLQQQAIGAGVEKVGIVPGNGVGAVEHQAQGEVSGGF